MFFFSLLTEGAFSHPVIPKSKVLFQTQPLSCSTQSASTLRQFLNAVTESNDTSFIKCLEMITVCGWSHIDRQTYCTVLDLCVELGDVTVKLSNAYDERSNRIISPKASQTQKLAVPPQKPVIFTIFYKIVQLM